MAHKKSINTKAGQLKVFEKSVVMGDICMFLQKDPEQIPDLLPKLKEMINAAFLEGRLYQKQVVAAAHGQYMNVIGGKI